MQKQSKRVSSGVLALIGTGAKNAIHQSEIIKLTGLSSREVTIIMENLRRSGEVIISSCQGYYKPETVEELTDYINRERNRAKNILKTLQSAVDYKAKMQKKEP